MRKTMHLIGLGLAVVCLLSLPARSQASEILFGLNEVYTGTTPSGPAPWATMDFKDVAPNQVLLTLTATNLVVSEFISQFSFNYNPAKTLSHLIFALQSGVAYVDTDLDLNGDHAGPIHAFDAEIDFATANKGHRFGAGSVSQILITTSQSGDNLTALDFDFVTPFHNVSFSAAAHVQSIPGGDEDSAWIGKDPFIPVVAATPEPGTMLLMSLGVLGAAFLSRRGKKSN